MNESLAGALEPKLTKHNIKGYHKHILFCGGPKCCAERMGDEVWAKLKKRLSEKDPEKHIFRTKTKCLRICQGGPIAVVYPSGAWYASVNEENIDKLVDEALLSDEVVESLCIATNEGMNGIKE